MNDNEKKELINVIQNITTVYDFFYKQVHDSDLATDKTVEYILLSVKIGEKMKDTAVPYRFVVDIQNNGK